MSYTDTHDFLVRAAREFRRGGWVFTGFHWPVLAGQCAHALSGNPFAQIFEAGVSTHEAGQQVPTSTTDYTAFSNAFGYVGQSSEILLSGARKFDLSVLDASNVDVQGRVNSSFIGESRDNLNVRLPGGGGAPDIANQARELLLLSGADSFQRFQKRLEHVTAAPGPATLTRLHTRWGVLRLGTDPVLEEIADVRGADDFVTHCINLGIDTHSPAERTASTPEEHEAAHRVLVGAANRGYHVATRALQAMSGE